MKLYEIWKGIKEESNQSNINDNFKKWFGNSKITDGGKPMICYHGSSESNIKVFDSSKVGYNSGNYGHYGYGIYFSSDIKEAKTYGSNIYKCYISIKKPFTGTDTEIIKLKRAGVDNIDNLVPISIDIESFKNAFKKIPYIYEFIDTMLQDGEQTAWDNVRDAQNSGIDTDLLNDISNMMEYTTWNAKVNGVPEWVFDELKRLKIKVKFNKGFEYQQSLHYITDLGMNSKEITNVIKKLGYDGVWYGSEIVCFKPNQIKSINNDGTWDINDDNIYS